jgi:hypothetical protein
MMTLDYPQIKQSNFWREAVIVAGYKIRTVPHPHKSNDSLARGESVEISAKGRRTRVSWKEFA